MKRARLALCLWSLLALTATALAQDIADSQDTPQTRSTNDWASAETLLWWVKSGPTPPPLATTAPDGSPGPIPGSLGNPDTTIVLGGERIAYPMQVGGRFTLGAWLAPDSPVGIEGNYLFLAESKSSSTVASDGSVGLYTPFTDVASGTPNSYDNVLVRPGIVNHGSATLVTSHELQGAEINGLYLMERDDAGSVSLIVGYRFLFLEEDLTLLTTEHDSVTYFPGQFINTADQFNTRNFFNGGQLGLRREWSRGAWSLSTTLKVALGNTREVIHVRGSSTTNSGAGFAFAIPVQTVPSGIYAEPTNIGRFQIDRFAALPEVMIRVSRQVTDHLQLFVAYNLLYLTSVARPGDQIDGTINASELVSFYGLPQTPLVGAARPEPQYASTSYWAQGINLGATIVW
jgi:hypothetical protein